MSEPLKESLKELGRLVLFAVISVAVSFAIDKLVAIPETETTAVLIFGLRFLDKWIHEHSKKVENPRIEGIAPF